MPKSKGWILKLGGSLALAPELPGWLGHLANADSRCVIVPGGGRFADEVRATQAQWRYPDGIAHRMAVLAMAAYGLMLQGLAPNLPPLHTLSAVRAAVRCGSHGVWIPQLADIEVMSALPQDWSVSADSIALWLAGYCDAAGLRLIKSSTPTGGSKTALALASEGYLDSHFPTALARANIRVEWFAKHELNVFTGAQSSTVAREIE